MKLFALGDPGTFRAQLDGGYTTEAGEFAGKAFEVIAALEKRTGFVFVGEDNIYALAKLVKDPVAGGVDDLKGGKINAQSAAGIPGAGHDLVCERGIKEEVAFDVGVAGTLEVGD